MYLAERGTFYAVLLIAIVVLPAEALYFEREVLEEEVRSFEGILEERAPDVGER